MFELARYPDARGGFIGTSSSIRRVDPDTLRPLTNRGLHLPDGVAAPVLSPDGERAAFGGETFGELIVVDLARMRVAKPLEVTAPAPVSVFPIGWPRQHLLVAHTCVDTGKYGCLRNRLVLVDPDRRVVLRRIPLPASVSTRYDARGRRAVALSWSRTHAIAPARFVVVDSDGRVRETRLRQIRVGTEQRRLGPYMREAALVLEPDRGRALVIGSGEPVAEVDLDALRVRYHPVAKLDPPKDALEAVQLRRWMGTANPFSDSYRRARRLWPGGVLVDGLESELTDDRGVSVRELFLRSRLLDTRRWKVRFIARGDVVPVRGLLGVFEFGPHRSRLVVYDSRLRPRYRIGGDVVAPIRIRNRLYVGRKPDGSITRVFDATTGRLVRHIRPRQIQDGFFVWAPPR